MLKITAYAEHLLSDLDDLDWPESIKDMQRSWIGKSTGANVTFKIKDSDKEFTVFTTRPDTLFGATYAVLAPEHDLVDIITSEAQKEAVAAYKQQASLKSDLARMDLAKDKTGVWTGSYAINHVNVREIPIWISDYVLVSYGTGAIMAVPAHDERDWEFAKQFGLDIIPVLDGGDVNQAAYIEDGPHINSDFLNGLDKAVINDEINKTLQRVNNNKNLTQKVVKNEKNIDNLNDIYNNSYNEKKKLVNESELYNYYNNLIDGIVSIDDHINFANEIYDDYVDRKNNKNINFSNSFLNTSLSI